MNNTQSNNCFMLIIYTIFFLNTVADAISNYYCEII